MSLTRTGKFLFRILAAPGKHLLMPILYLVYPLLLFLIFFYLTFPFSKVESRVVSSLEQTLESQVRVGKSQRLFPLGLDWQSVSIYSPDGRQAGIELERVKARVHLLPLIRQRVEVDLLVDAYGGKLLGTLRIQRQGDEIQYHFQQSVQDINLQSIAQNLPFRLKGQAKMEAEARWQDPTLRGAAGTGQVEFLNVRAEQASFRGINIPDLSFVRIVTRLGLRNGLLSIKEFTAQGPLMEVRGRGTLHLRNRWSDSVFNVSARIYTQEELRAELPLISMMGNDQEPINVMIQGTWQRPQVSVNGIPFRL